MCLSALGYRGNAVSTDPWVLLLTYVSVAQVELSLLLQEAVVVLQQRRELCSGRTRNSQNAGKTPRLRPSSTRPTHLDSVLPSPAWIT